MNTEHILDAIGLLDDDLIRGAEEYSRPRASFDYRRWIGLAASFVVVLALLIITNFAPHRSKEQ